MSQAARVRDVTPSFIFTASLLFLQIFSSCIFVVMIQSLQNSILDLVMEAVQSSNNSDSHLSEVLEETQLAIESTVQAVQQVRTLPVWALSQTHTFWTLGLASCRQTLGIFSFSSFPLCSACAGISSLT